MKYELAKELKEAGFPFDFGNATVLDLNPPFYSFDRYPSLEELIEACPKMIPFSETHGYGYDGKFTLNVYQDSWHAGYELIDGWYEGGIGEGTSPVEAVARLWLAINKK